MVTHKSQFNRSLLVILVVLYVLTIAAFSYANWAAAPEFMQWWMMLLNIPILSIPLVLLYGSIYMLAIAWREHSTLGQVSPRLAKIIHWAPRAAAILIIFFISLFSLDVFEIEASPLELLGGFLIHNIPSIGMLVLLIFAWKRPMVGFVAFLAAAALFAFFFVRDIYALPNLLLFVLPILLVAFLFYANWKWLKPQPPAQVDAAAQP
ncbi:MAG: hypothetical protein JXA78_05710 [Anaerolineales bacterium]|nr:hypothetical protein [Anaerolineales bacterium]